MDRDAMMVELTRMSVFPKQRESFDFVGKYYLSGLLDDPKIQKLLRKLLKTIDYVQPLYAALRVTAGNVTSKACMALAPFAPNLPCDKRRRRAMNGAVNAVMDSTIRCGVTISAAASGQTEEQREATAAEDAEAAQVEAEHEDAANAALWYHDGGGEAWDGADADDAAGEDANDELGTAFGESKGIDTKGYGYVYANDTASFALPLLLKDECVRDGEITSSITIKGTCDAALISNVIGVDKHVSTGIAQFMGHGAPGKELALNQFSRNMSSDRAVVMRTGRGADKDPGWLTDNWIPMLKQISAINGAKQTFEIIQGLAPLQRTDDGGYEWKGPKVARCTTHTHSHTASHPFAITPLNLH
jgi:hypothetical protein